MPKLVLFAGTPQAQEYFLRPGKNFVGRAFANDIKLDDASVSGSHAVFIVTGDAVTVTDQGSTNGTRINQLPATGNPLQSGAVVKLGTVELLFVPDAAAAVPTYAPPSAPAAAKIATEFFIREPSHVGATSAPPPPPPPPAQVAPVSALRIPSAAPTPPPPPQPVAPAPAMTAPAPAMQGLRSAPPAPSPIAVVPAPAPILKIPVPASAAPPPPPPPISIAPAPPAPSPTAIAPNPQLIFAPPPPPPPATFAAAAAEAPPVSSGVRLSLAGTAAPAPATITIAPPPAAHTVAPAALAGVIEPIEAPAGLIACKFHRNVSGQWLCQKCTQLFCSLCVITRPTSGGTGHFCRACGTQCVPVKIKAVAKKKEKQITAYSEGTIVLRTVGFGAGGALLAAALWTGAAALMGTDILFINAIVVGAICGYAVKIASQDRPGGFFSAIAVVATLIGVILGKLGACYATHLPLTNVTGTVILTGIVGLMGGLFLSWKLGGGDF